VDSQRPRLKTADEIARLLNTSRRMVYYYRRQGMPAKKFGPRIFRFDEDEVLRWADANAAKASPEGPRPV
jgi:excisionase family DNA binding protein